MFFIRCNPCLVDGKRHCNQLIFKGHICGCNATLSRLFRLSALALEPLVSKSLMQTNIWRQLTAGGKNS